ncbi:MAG TPA: methyltransferase domain-containing protein [Bryobacteraceae bacterium]|nr:methyltransferase domain-containing protein [Bryobacteraceae bacterium]
MAYRLFLRESFRTIRTTASVFPSSRFLATAMLEHVDFANVRTMVELGSGTGAITGEILRRMRPDARLFAFEINRHFVEHLEETFPDPRLHIVPGDAEDLSRHLRSLGVAAAEVVISSLGLTGMKAEQRQRIICQVKACLSPRGVLTQYQYLTSQPAIPDVRYLFTGFQEKQFLESYFPTVRVKRVLLNLPPAEVYTCRKDVHARRNGKR